MRWISATQAGAPGENLPESDLDWPRQRPSRCRVRTLPSIPARRWDPWCRDCAGHGDRRSGLSQGSARPAVLIKRCRTVLTERCRRIAK